MLRHEPGTRLGENIEALHDMRVATRRMRAAFNVFGSAFDPKVLKPYLKGLRATGRTFGHARDMDVFMEKASQYQETLLPEARSGLQPLMAAWEEERSRARSAMLAHLDSEKYLKFKRAYNVFLHTPGAGVLSVSHDQPIASRVRDVVPALIYTRLASVQAYETILPTATIPQLHALRIEFKKLRYTVEYFKEVLGKSAKDVIDVLKGMQDHLGELHDADVACQIIRQFLDQWEVQQTNLPLDSRQSSEAIVAYLAYKHAERHRLMVSFPEAWKCFNCPELRQNLALAIAVL
jgi:CHAD domain-containing protein